MDKTVSDIINRLKSGRDCIVFSPGFQPDPSVCSQLLREINEDMICVVSDKSTCPSGENTFFIHSGMSERACEETLRQCENTSLYTLFLTPSVFQQDSILHLLHRKPPKALVVPDGDPAGALHWFFSKEYRYVGDIQSQLRERIPCCVFSLDDSSKNIRELKNVFSLRTPVLYYPGVQPVRQTLTVCKTTLPIAELEKYIRLHSVDRMIVFCTSRQSARDANCYFSFFGYSCLCTHGGLTAAECTKRIEQFNQAEKSILFTTWLFGGLAKQGNDRIGFLGLPVDLYQFYRYTCKTDFDIPVIYSDTDEEGTLAHITEDAEERSAYSVYRRNTLLKERMTRHEEALHFIGNHICAYNALQQINGDVFYEPKM